MTEAHVSESAAGDRAPDIPSHSARPEPLTATFPGRSEMAQRCRAFDWAATTLGQPETWPVSLRTLVATMLAARHPMILFWGPDRVQLYNDAYVPALGPGRHPAALGMRAADCWQGAVWDIVGPQVDDVVATGEATRHEDQYVPLPRHDTVEETYWAYSYSPAFDDAGRVAGVLVVTQETTARVRAERALVRLTAASPAVMAVYSGPDHVLTYLNPTWERVVGKPGALGRPFRDVFPEMAATPLLERLARVYATGERYAVDEMLLPIQRWPGGPVEESYWSFVWEPAALPDASSDRDPIAPAPRGGSLSASGLGGDILCHAIDVTGPVLARRQTEALQGVTAALAEARTLDDVAGVVVGAMADVAGARAGSLAVPAPGGDALRLVRTFGFSADVAARVQIQPLDLASPIPEAFRTGEPIWAPRRDGPDGMDARYPAVAHAWAATGIGSGAYVPLVVAGRPVGVVAYAFPEPRAFDHGERAFLLALARQVAVALERARLSDAERAAREEAEAAQAAAVAAQAEAELANHTKSAFLATMSHELRTPLNAIGGYAELLGLGVHGPVTADQVGALERIQRAQRHLLGLSNGVPNYAKIDAGAVHYAITDVSLDEVLRTCEALVAPQMRAKSLTLAYAGVAPALCARADREKLQQVVLNLLSNAVKFTPAGGRATLAVAPAAPGEGALVRITVADTGVGIPADQLTRVFEPFVQVDTAYTRTQEGTGLGLAISRDLARGMGGDLTAESTVGSGSTFTLWLPPA